MFVHVYICVCLCTHTTQTHALTDICVYAYTHACSQKDIL